MRGARCLKHQYEREEATNVSDRAEPLRTETGWRVCCLATEQMKTRGAVAAPSVPGFHRCDSMPSCWVTMPRGMC